MFKVNDIIKPKNSITDRNYMVTEVSFDHINVVEIINNKECGIYFHMASYAWEHDKNYYRRLKLKKICSKLETE